MKFNTIIIGGGLSGLTAGIKLSKQGQRVAIVSAGQSALHFGSGSFELLGYDEAGAPVSNPLEEISKLSAKHPYAKIGAERVPSLAEEAAKLLAEADIAVSGTAEKNHLRVTPIGVTKPAWLTVDGYVTEGLKAEEAWKSATILNVEGFLDFQPAFIKSNLEKRGIKCELREISIDELRNVRRSPSEMRAVNIAKILSGDAAAKSLADQINALDIHTDVILFPAVIGVKAKEDLSRFLAMVKHPLRLVATMPPSVSGMYATYRLKKAFTDAGGTILVGDTALSGRIENGEVKGIKTEKLPEEELQADNYILATGSFISHGLKSNYDGVFEPVFGLDTNVDMPRTEWGCENMFKAQPYMEFGVLTDADFHAIKGGSPLRNLFAIGSVLGGHNRVKLADGEGVSLLTALHVANLINNK